MKVQRKKPSRVRVWYEVTFRMEVEQDETGDDKGFDAENSIRVDLESLKRCNGSQNGHVRYLNIEDVGALTEEQAAGLYQGRYRR